MILKTLETPAKSKIIIARKNRKIPKFLSDDKRITISPSMPPTTPYHII